VLRAWRWTATGLRREGWKINNKRKKPTAGPAPRSVGIALGRGLPTFVRFDNGPELIADAVADWCRFNGVGTIFIDRGSPWQNAWIESFNSRLRDELLNGWHFDSLLEAQVAEGGWSHGRSYGPLDPNAASLKALAVAASMSGAGLAARILGGVDGV
jgi:putative transposase